MILWAYIIAAFAVGVLMGGWLTLWHLTRYGGFAVTVTWRER